MDRYGDRSRHQAQYERHSHAHSHNGGAGLPEFRQFAMEPIVGPNRQGFGAEVLFRAGWEDSSSGDPTATSRIMLDNWLLYGFEELIGGRAVFLNCTRESLMSGFLPLLPRLAVFEIQESVQPDAEVLSVCRSLKAAGYRFCLDDFASPDQMEAFLELADFIKVDFRHSGRRQRACMLRRLKLTGATLIAANIETEEDFQQAADEGFGLFQGYHAGDSITFAKKRDSLDPLHCVRLLGTLHESGPDSASGLNELLDLINLESGIECRLLRRANWAAPSNAVINSTRDALATIGNPELQKIVTLAMTAVSEEAANRRPIPHPHSYFRHGAAIPVNRIVTGAPTMWWHGTGQAGIL